MGANLVTDFNGLTMDDTEGMHAAYEETQYRQSINYVSPLSYTTQEEKPVACGTIEDVNNGSSGMMQSMLSGIFLVAFLSFLLKYFRAKQLVPIINS
jgi:hypothetical protein